MNEELLLAGERFELEAARRIIAGYCFAEVDSLPKPPRGDTYGVRLEPWRRRRWGYLSYDCQRGPGPPPDIADLIAPVLLNVTRGYGVELVSDLLAIAPRIRAVVGSIRDKDFRFWHLTPDDVVPRGIPQEGTPSQALHQSWYLVESVRGADVAITHKLLHHAWPHLFPLIDNRTIVKLDRDNAWVTILKDLRRMETEFDQLERWFQELADSRGEVGLTRLRLYDILLWCHVTGEEKGAAEAGRSFVESGWASG